MYVLTGTTKVKVTIDVFTNAQPAMKYPTRTTSITDCVCMNGVSSSQGDVGSSKDGADSSVGDVYSGN
jgi:hypothetical protein